MTDLRQRLRELDAATPSDLWGRIEARNERAPDPVARRLDTSGGGSPGGGNRRAGGYGRGRSAPLAPPRPLDRSGAESPTVDDLVRDPSALIVNVAGPEDGGRPSAIATYGDTTAHLCLDSYATTGPGG